MTTQEKITASYRMVADFERIAAESSERAKTYVELAQADADALADAKRELQALELQLERESDLKKNFAHHV